MISYHDDDSGKGAASAAAIFLNVYHGTHIDGALKLVISALANEVRLATEARASGLGCRGGIRILSMIADAFFGEHAAVTS